MHAGPQGFLALSRWCRHANGLLSYQREHWRFYCAFHGATYNLEGDHTGHLPNIPALRVNPVTIDERGHVMVDTDMVEEREDGIPPCYTAACGLAAHNVGTADELQAVLRGARHVPGPALLRIAIGPENRSAPYFLPDPVELTLAFQRYLG